MRSKEKPVDVWVEGRRLVVPGGFQAAVWYRSSSSGVQVIA